MSKDAERHEAFHNMFKASPLMPFIRTLQELRDMEDHVRRLFEGDDTVTIRFPDGAAVDCSLKLGRKLFPKSQVTRT